MVFSLLIGQDSISPFPSTVYTFPLFGTYYTQTTAMVRRQQYTTDTLADAVDQVCARESPTKVASLLRIPLRTLTKQVKPSRSGAYLEQARRGLLPMLTEEGEAYLVEWIKGMQFNGTSASGSTCCTERVRWCHSSKVSQSPCRTGGTNAS